MITEFSLEEEEEGRVEYVQFLDGNKNWESLKNQVFDNKEEESKNIWCPRKINDQRI